MQLEDWKRFRRLLVVRLDNIGDVVMLEPALRALRENLPQTNITLLTSPAGSQVGPLLPWINSVLVHRAVWQDASFSFPFDPQREFAFIEELRRGRYHAMIIFTSFSQSPYPPAFAGYLAGIPIRVGQTKDFGGSILSHWIKPPADGVHQVDRNLHLLESAGISVKTRHLELDIPLISRRSAERLLSTSGIIRESEYIVLAPGASCAARRYNTARFAGVARSLIRVAGLPVIVVGNVKEKELLRPILDTGASSLIGEISIPELAAVIQGASLIIGNDSGPMHVADAFRKPMVILFSGTDLESQWRPRNSPAVLMRRPTDCSPCYLFQCPYSMECLDISEDEVVETALELLSTTASGTEFASRSGLRVIPHVIGGD